MAYTHDTGTDEGVVRTLIYDTTSEGSPVKGTDYWFSDAEITATLDQNNDDVWKTAADLCRALTSLYARQAFDLGLGKGDIKLDRRKKSEMYMMLAAQYDNKAGGEVSEYMDSVAYGVDFDGKSSTEYVGD